MKVEAGTPLVGFTPHVSGRAAMMKPTGRVGFVRRLVLREANIPIDSKHRSLGIAADLGGEACEPNVQILDQPAHGIAYVVLVLHAMGFKPRFVVVRLELAKKAKGSGVERHIALLQENWVRLELRV